MWADLRGGPQPPSPPAPPRLVEQGRHGFGFSSLGSWALLPLDQGCCQAPFREWERLPRPEGGDPVGSRCHRLTKRARRVGAMGWVRESLDFAGRREEKEERMHCRRGVSLGCGSVLSGLVERL